MSHFLEKNYSWNRKLLLVNQYFFTTVPTLKLIFPFPFIKMKLVLMQNISIVHQHLNILPFKKRSWNFCWICFAEYVKVLSSCRTIYFLITVLRHSNSSLKISIGTIYFGSIFHIGWRDDSISYTTLFFGWGHRNWFLTLIETLFIPFLIT